MVEKDFEKSVSEPLKLRFASYNIFHGGRADYDMSRIAKNITDNGIDVVGIQEVDRGVARSGGIDTLAELSRESGYPYYAFFKTIDLDGGDYGIGVLSKYPILATDKLLLDGGAYEKRALGFTEIDVYGRKISFLVTHLSFRAAKSREEQLSILAAELAKKNDFVLSGDFNSSDLGAIDLADGIGRVNKKEAPTVTFPDGSLSIDNILYSKSHWQFDEINVITESYSDHFMIWADATFID